MKRETVPAQHFDRLFAILRDVWREAQWQPIDTAPRDGTHVLACWGRYSESVGFNQAPPCVVHFWSNPGEEGFYNSLGDTEEPLEVSFWRPLGEPPNCAEASVLPASTVEPVVGDGGKP